MQIRERQVGLGRKGELWNMLRCTGVYWEAGEINGVLGELPSGENQVHECVWWCTESCREISRPDWSLGCSQTQ